MKEPLPSPSGASRAVLQTVGRRYLHKIAGMSALGAPIAKQKAHSLLSTAQLALTLIEASLSHKHSNSAIAMPSKQTL